MTEQTSTRCLICDAKLESEKEQNIHICYTCRAYGLLNNCWPERGRIFVFQTSAAASARKGAMWVRTCD